MNSIYNPSPSGLRREPGYHARGKGGDNQDGSFHTHSLPNPVGRFPLRAGFGHDRVSRETVRMTVYNQSQTETPDQECINFRSFRRLCNRVAGHITGLVGQCIQLRLHPQEWKKEKRVILRKVNQVDYTVVRSYLVISLVNCMGKVCKKGVANMLTD